MGVFLELQRCRLIQYKIKHPRVSDFVAWPSLTGDFVLRVSAQRPAYWLCFFKFCFGFSASCFGFPAEGRKIGFVFSPGKTAKSTYLLVIKELTYNYLNYNWVRFAFFSISVFSDFEFRISYFRP